MNNTSLWRALGRNFIISIILAILGILLFKVLARITFYYKEVYIRPVLHVLFRKDKAIAPVHKKLPRKIRKAYPSATFACPMFAFKGISKVPSRSVLWFVIENDKAHLIVKKAFRKLREISIPELREANPAAVIVQLKRFYELKAPDKSLDIVIGKSYKDHIDGISRSTGFPVKESD